MKLLFFQLCQAVWVNFRAIAEGVLGKNQFNKLIDWTGIRKLKNKYWLSKKTLPDGSVIYYRPHDQGILDEIAETDTYNLKDLKPGQTVIDAGAHIGVFSVMAARRVGDSGRVISFEPSPNTRQLLLKNILANHLPWVKVYDVALAESEGTTDLYIASDGENNPVADTLTAKDNRTKVEVKLKKLDDVLADENISKVNLLKIDVEAAELRLLDGASKTLSMTQHIVMEVHPPAVTPAQVEKKLTDYGFKCHTSTKNGCVILEARRPHPI